MAEVRPGRYLHFKGNEYTVVDVAIHTETGEEFVVYRQEYGERLLFVRPKDMFQETVTRDGKTMPRFKYVGEK